ncbi:hypothetical protein M4I21_04425 [Cellulophaga sp. 20_2_10]|uniref:hypothetical protein n=1 Tax=Cellulophaga sp. 20_2_10 TaxID=2942476 RepID=UPI00201A57F5|nr:hypothetical protein [Cellulophaga sp. 20_2_10]MCL5245040.1 hypothetical protein [Cellulophaga sp. 20_2_10]
MKSRFLYLAILVTLALPSNAQNKKVALEQTINDIVTAFKEKNSNSLNSFIAKEIGVTIVVRYGVLDNYVTLDSIDFNNPTPSYLPYTDPISSSNLTFTTLPSFSCDTENWSKKGLYCDTLLIPSLLSNTITNLKYELSNDAYQKELKRAYTLEKNSCRVILIDTYDEDLIFHLTYIHKKWTLTVIDRVTSDCSA